MEKKNNRDWDVQLPYVLFAYHTFPHESTGESPFFLMYRRDPVLPTTDMLTGLTHSHGRSEVDFGNYTVEMTAHMASVWQAAGIIFGLLNLNRNRNMTNPRKLNCLVYHKGPCNAVHICRKIWSNFQVCVAILKTIPSSQDIS